MRVAFLGVRSVPGRYGGFDTVATELAPRLVRRGCEVTVYCQTRYVPRPRAHAYAGVRLVYLPAVPMRAAEETSHELFSLLHAATERYDILYVFGLRATLIFAPAIALGARVLFNTDGHDWQRRKWGPLARRYLLLSERVGARIAPQRLVSDSRAIAAYFGREYGVRPTFLTYGAPEVGGEDPAPLARYGLEPGRYYLVLCRLEPENNIDAIIAAYNKAQPDRDLAVVGGVNYGGEYIARLRATASERVRFLGAIYERDAVDALYRHSFAYLHGHEVGGTNPALLHAMAAGACVLANDVVYNREVLGDAGDYWNGTAVLADAMLALEQDPERAQRLGAAAKVRVRAEYDWEAIADGYVKLFGDALAAER
jgi:glycosyltransferase involved in cell wall biosynthesis